MEVSMRLLNAVVPEPISNKGGVLPLSTTLSKQVLFLLRIRQERKKTYLMPHHVPA